MKYLLIDGNNLAIRSAFANDQLTNSEGICTAVHYGFFQSIFVLKKNYPDYKFLIVWDGKSKRREKESSDGVEKGIIKATYKANRKEKELPRQLQDYYSQSDILKRAVGATGIPQIMLPDYEADDVIASYCNILKSKNKVVVLTSDKDYWQVLDDNVSMYDGMKREEITKKGFIAEKGINPKQAVDLGALVGDKSDNIFGVVGWGEKTALKEIIKNGSYKGVYNFYHEKYDKYRAEYPDLCEELYNEESCKLDGDELEHVKEVMNAKTKKDNLVYKEVTIAHPWSGVLVAFHDNKVNISKSILNLLIFEDRADLAYSLKKMDDNIEGLPEIEKEDCDKEKLLTYFDYFDINTFEDDIELLT